MVKERENVTAQDVAALAGVSQSAVSRTFTPGASVSKKMTEKVRRAPKSELAHRSFFISFLGRDRNRTEFDRA